MHFRQFDTSRSQAAGRLDEVLDAVESDLMTEQWECLGDARL